MEIATQSEGEGPALVLIHGVGTDRTIFSRAVPHLAERRRLVRLDLPGFGESPPPENGWELAAVAEAIGEELETLLDEPFDLLGSSLGGAVALAIADARPRGLRRLLLAAPAGFRPVPRALAEIAGHAVGPLLWARRSAGLRLADVGIARRLLFAGNVGDGAQLDPEAARLILAASERAVSLRPALRAAATADLREPLERLPNPPGLLWGSLDRVVPPIAAERIHEAQPDAPIEILPGVGHLPHVERPREFATAVERLIEQLP